MLVSVHTRYGSVKPGLYKMVREGRDYYEIKWRGSNILVPKEHVE